VRVVPVALAFALIAVPRGASAYCRATTCDPQGAKCEPPLPTDCGTPLRWRRDCVGVAVQSDASSQVTYAETKGTVRAAFGAWEQVDCGGVQPGIHVEILNKVDCAEVEYNETGGNVNVVVFRDDEWPHAEGLHNVALTTVTFEKESGEIYDADIEINTAEYPMTVSDEAATTEYDLLSILTHEAGHFLGMAHAVDNPDATMNATYQPMTLDFRTLEPDDAAGICAIYLPDSEPPSEDCNPIPRHGFSASCLTEQTEGTCSAAPASGPSPARTSKAHFAAALLALAAVLRWRRSRRW
jgi:MYXO-CTERM domain-containing protein